jgi:hypothetical protein
LGKADVGVGVIVGVEIGVNVGVGVKVAVKVSDGLGVWVQTTALAVGEGVFTGTRVADGRLHADSKPVTRMIMAKLAFKAWMGSGLLEDLFMVGYVLIKCKVSFESIIRPI